LNLKSEAEMFFTQLLKKLVLYFNPQSIKQ
jgi:hypothetical protein